MSIQEPAIANTQSCSPPALPLVQCAMLSALAVAAGHALAFIPNLELTTLVIFFSGVHAGPRGGAVTAMITAIYFNYLNPMGPAIPPIFAAQAAGWIVVAITGAWLGPWACGEKRAHAWLRLALIGGGLTLVYDILTNLAHIAAFAPGITIKAGLAVLAAGAPFAVVHIIGNSVAFALLGPSLGEILRRATSFQ